MSETLNVFEARAKELENQKNRSEESKTTPTDMINVFAARAKELKDTSVKDTSSTNIFVKRAKELNNANATQTPSDRGFFGAFKGGTKSGVSGLLTGNRPQPLPEDATWLEQLGAMSGKFISDYPAMIPGAELGALGGGVLGSVVPGIGTAIGGLVGGGAGALALPTAIDQAYEEYYKYVDKGGEGTFGDFISGIGNVAKETGKQAALGGATGLVSKALPVLKKIPGFDKLLQTNLGRKATGTGLEYGAMTIGQAALEGRTPTMQEAVNNALLLGGIKAATGTGRAIKALGRKAFFKQGVQEKMYFDMLKDHVGERNARLVESQFKWRDALERAESQEKFTPENLEEMMYYRQKTGNPNKSGDSYLALSERLPQNARNFVDNVVGPHLEESLKSWNEHPLTRKINPREALEDIYLPGLYENEPGKIKQAYNETSKRFKVANPMANPKVFLTYMDAMESRGLKPRYKNIVDLMRAYDNINIKILSNIEFLNNIKSAERNWSKTSGDPKYQGINKLIVNSVDRKRYNKAKDAGYVSFDDPFLRRYVSGKEGEEPIWGMTLAPALVHPDLAPSLAGVFRKEPYKDPNLFWKAADSLSNELKHIEVAGSLFHYGSLFQHTGGLQGTKKAFQSIAPWYTSFKADADALLRNKEVMMDAARSGLVVHKRVEGLGEQPTMIGKAMDKIAEKLPAAVKDTKFVNWASEKLAYGMKHLFDVHHPRLKIKAWNDMTQKYMTENPNANVKEVKKDIAKVVNNVYGGQNWETMKYLNDPDTLRSLRRVIAFPDWTLSQIRAADVGLPGGNASIAQKEARRYWLHYGLFLGAFHGFLKWFNSGLEQTDPDKSPMGVRFNPEKANQGLNPFKQDPKNWYKVPLPDLPMKIAGKEFNPGRAEDGRKLNFQMMKSALELGGWANNMFAEFFKKSNPLIRAAFKQITGASLSEDGTYPVRALWSKETPYYKRGKPWEGSKPWTLERFRSRAQELASEFKPFSFGGIERHGVAPFIASGLGAGSVSKGLSLHDAEDYIESALKSKDNAKLNNIRRVLKDNGYSDKSINSTITKLRNRI